ncbi:Protease synthase and sporulation protein PAI 2 [Planococcus massiliensis]|uniref:Protease synthase and sporulation protein PAI 2 n=1 Tax=Planococcus massiliensis TaxID=1499687 RepID=A0A098EIY0_9BACL|nr:FMN-binding negative transcriptional regulator [Planococcus massiliensis]CEG21251.1 Protease synthase and sporulation protein PAI 2 [Planococcus massiliensis]
MYIPKQFKVTDFDEVREFLQQHAFGTLVTTRKGRPIATHLPFQFAKEQEGDYLTGHMAYGNPQWRTFETTEEVLAMFQGPHAYISSSWYEQENVPTWNYQSVHVYGTPQLLSGQELQQDLAALLDQYEKHRKHAVLWETLSPELLEKELKGIVGFKIRITEIQAANKLSQNRSEADYRNIVQNLQAEESAASVEMAHVMKKKRVY